MKRIGIVVDGSAESQALRGLTGRITISGMTLIGPIYADMQPKASAKQIAAAAAPKLKILTTAKRVEHTVVLIDREDRTECCGGWAKKLERAFGAIGYANVTVGIKNRQFENWLLADVDALKALHTLFKVTRTFERLVVPNKADHILDPTNELSKIRKGNRSYHKRRDAQKITALQDPDKVARNSRSFRRFLRLLAHPRYAEQSKKPCE